MSNPAIIVDGISKKYRIGLKERPYQTFREAATGLISAPLRLARSRSRKGPGADDADFWALRDVSFDVQPGEVVGIIGRNGAGKSTLLKILSRITEPTAGEVRLTGRVASLLEVGTGFHPELTGRENIYLNGAILGMKRAEITRKFDEIVAFAEVEKFLDTAVKYYSSGMYVRLAFAVAAHLEPEILIVDEVLAVGDAQFQKKCLGKIKEVSGGEGRTVLFVSHNSNAINALCNRAILLESGALAAQGSARETLDKYLSKTKSSSHFDLRSHSGRSKGVAAVISDISFANEHGAPAGSVYPDEVMFIGFNLHSHSLIRDPRLSVGVNDARGERLFAVATFLSQDGLRSFSGHTQVKAAFRLPALIPGQYSVDVGLSDGPGTFVDAIYSAGAFDVADNGYLNTTTSPFRDMGQIMVRSRWGAEELPVKYDNITN